MKIWKTVKLKEQSKEINQISIALSNYIYKNSPINDIFRKYNIDTTDKQKLDKYTQDRIAGILMLYASKNIDRINDIVNRYNTPTNTIVTPELEAYIEK